MIYIGYVFVILEKVRRLLNRMCYKYTGSWKAVYCLYGAYWHYLFSDSNKTCDKVVQYYSARPNPRAGIGHQMANWNAGFWWAKQFGLTYAHIPFSVASWDEFLGLGKDEITVDELVDKGYKVRRLPLFRQYCDEDLLLQKRIISSYRGKRIVFIAEQDQGYRDQYGVMEDIQRKFYSAPARKNDCLVFDNTHFNIAIHARRGDIMADSKNPNLTMRILTNQYFYNALKEALDILETDKEVHIYFFSQGTPADFPEFSEFRNLHWCFDMSTQQSFLHMVYADLLITSKSSFSYKPALLNKGIKVCPRDFWHGYPVDEKWILCNNEGHLER